MRLPLCQRHALFTSICDPLSRVSRLHEYKRTRGAPCRSASRCRAQLRDSQARQRVHKSFSAAQVLRWAAGSIDPLPRGRLQLRDGCVCQQVPQERAVGLHQQPAVPQLQCTRGLRNLLELNE